MEPSVYLEERLEGQRKWYSRKSSINKSYYYWFKILTIVFSILIPVILGLEKYGFLENASTAIASVLGALVAILTSISGFMKFREKWINYRTCSERLKRERFLYQTASAPYNKTNPFETLVSKVENIIGGENLEWSSYISEEQEPA